MIILSLVSFPISYFFEFLIPQGHHYGFWSNLWMGIFVSSILIVLSSIVAYFSERTKQLRIIIDLIYEAKNLYNKLLLGGI